MILSLSETCPIFSPAAETYLHRLLYAVTVDGWHLLAIPAPDRLEAMLPQHIWTTYGEQLRQTYPKIVNSPQRVVALPDCGGCDPAKVVGFYTLPVILLVEDVDSDGGWLKLVAHTLRRRLVHHMVGSNPDLDIRHTGGISQMPGELRRFAEQHRSVRPDATMPLRLVAIPDSDAKLPGAISQDAALVIHVAKQEGADAHVLSKRTIENYIPGEALLEYASTRRDRLAAARYITTLSRTAHDHYPMKDGLTKEDLADASVLYGASPQIRLGMGDFIVDFVTNFGYHVTEARHLRARDGANELEAILDMLERNL